MGAGLTRPHLPRLRGKQTLAALHLQHQRLLLPSRRPHLDGREKRVRAPSLPLRLPAHFRAGSRSTLDLVVAMPEAEIRHLRVLIVNEKRERLELPAQVVAGLGHEVIAREI
jgi:hypothetical protein